MVGHGLPMGHRLVQSRTECRSSQQCMPLARRNRQRHAPHRIAVRGLLHAHLRTTCLGDPQNSTGKCRESGIGEPPIAPPNRTAEMHAQMKPFENPWQAAKHMKCSQTESKVHRPSQFVCLSPHPERGDANGTPRSVSRSQFAGQCEHS